MKKTKPNKPKVKIGKMNITSFITMNYEQITMNDEKNKPKQTQPCPPPADSNRKAEAKNGTFLILRPTYIIGLCERAGPKYIMSCLF